MTIVIIFRHQTIPATTVYNRDVGQGREGKNGGCTAFWVAEVELAHEKDDAVSVTNSVVTLIGIFL